MPEATADGTVYGLPGLRQAQPRHGYGSHIGDHEHARGAHCDQVRLRALFSVDNHQKGIAGTHDIPSGSDDGVVGGLPDAQNIKRQVGLPAQYPLSSE